jgi:hypothetical protein
VSKRAPGSVGAFYQHGAGSYHVDCSIFGNSSKEPDPVEGTFANLLVEAGYAIPIVPFSFSDNPVSDNSLDALGFLVGCVPLGGSTLAPPH